MRIRAAEPGDEPELAVLWEALCRELGVEPGDTESWISMTEGLIPNSEGYVCLLLEDEVLNIMGFVDGFMMYEPATAALALSGRHMYVVPQLRNTGISRRLLLSFIKEAKARGAKRMMMTPRAEDTGRFSKVGFNPAYVIMERSL
jgi:GNAT superfamily N-acetyltransferase